MTETATFAAGCFWGVEYKFSKRPGVARTAVGYAGGHVDAPSYQQVCTDRTGHAEVVQLEFDPAVVSYEQLVRFFFSMHDPTTPNRQGPDLGSQYRSAIFCHSPQQQAIAQKVLAELNAQQFGGRIATRIEMAQAAWKFWPAEEYHQKYVDKHGPDSCAL